MDFGNYGNYGDGGFNAEANYSEENGSQRQQTRSSLSPVTIKQIHDASPPVPDGEFMVNNVALNIVSFVGVVRKVENNTSAVTITVEDGTGSVDVRKWADEKIATAAEEGERFLALENKYVYVTGALKELQLKKSIQHATIREVSDYNEVLYHMLYAIENHLEAQGLMKPAIKPEQGLFVDPNDASSSRPVDISDKVLEIISSNTPSMPDGVPVAMIADQVGLPVERIKQICLGLSEAGNVYQGYDENAYMSI